jgi:hypothetical protein
MVILRIEFIKPNLMKFQLVFTILFLSFSSNFSFAAIDSKYKEALQRGYQLEGDSVVFPDGTKCLMLDFNAGICGEIWMTENYCVPEGAYVWDNDKCCNGLEAYLPEGMAGQATCQPINKGLDEEDDFMNNFIYFFIGIGIVFTLFVFGIILIKLKNR